MHFLKHTKNNFVISITLEYAKILRKNK